jgi:oligoendopeptidase F
MDAFATLKGRSPRGRPSFSRRIARARQSASCNTGVPLPALQRDTDTRVQDVAGKFQRVTALFAKFGTITAWFTPELLGIPQATVEQWIRETPELVPYRFPILEDFRKQKHVLDERGEKLLSFAARSNQTPRSVYTELSTSDIKFPAVKLADGSESS